MTTPMPTVDAYQQFRQMRYFGSLDGLRALSILAVILYHCWLPPELFAVARVGFLGVDLFFTLSGFLIVTLLLRERESAGTISLRAFYRRRSLRIFPIYYGLIFALTLACLFASVPGETQAKFWAALPYYLTYTSNWLPNDQQAGYLAVTWSLAAEEQFYSLWPSIEKYLPRRAVWASLGVLLVLNQLLNFGLLGPWMLAQQALLNILQVTFTPIFLGVLLAHLLHHSRSFGWLDRVFGRRLSAPLFAMLLLAQCQFAPSDIQGLPRLLIQLTMTALLAACVIRDTHGGRWLLRLTPLRYWGRISYGLYLYHWYTIAMVEGLATRWPLGTSARIVLVLVLATLVAGVSFRVIEQPFLRWKERSRPPAPA